MKLNRKLMLVLAVVLSVAMAVGGTMAYLQDTDEDVNVMTLGNVYITQNEQERNDEGDLVQFTQGKPMYPAVYEGDSYPADLPENWPVANNGAWEMTEQNENVIDKIVTVTNTGKSPAYVRTYIAFEGIGEYGPEGGCVHINTNGSNVGDEIAAELVGTTQVDGVDYTVYAYTYLQPLAPGETTIPSLKQVYLDKTAGNKEVAHYGETYDILVYSQAVQAEGFADAQTALDEAFGKPAVTNVLWDDMEIPDLIYNYEQLADACAKGGSYIIGDDIEMDNFMYVRDNTEVSFDLNGYELTNTIEQYTIVSQTGAKLTLEGDGVVNLTKGIFVSDGEITIDGGTYNFMNTSGEYKGRKYCSYMQKKNSKITINDGVFKTNHDNAALFYFNSNSVLEINGGFFENTADTTPLLFIGGMSGSDTNLLILKGGTFVNFNPLTDLYNNRVGVTQRPADESQISLIKGGFQCVIWPGYDVVSETQDNGDIWYTVVKK